MIAETANFVISVARQALECRINHLKVPFPVWWKESDGTPKSGHGNYGLIRLLALTHCSMAIIKLQIIKKTVIGNQIKENIQGLGRRPKCRFVVS